MRYQEYLPENHTLREYIDAFWTISFESEQFRKEDLVIPDGGVEWVFNLGDCYERECGVSFQQSALSQIVGFRTNSVRIKQTNNTSLFVIRFKPYGLNLMGFDEGIEIVNDVVQNCRIFGDLEERIFDLLMQDNPIGLNIQLIEKLLIEKFELRKVPKVLTKSWKLIIQNEGQIRIENLCASVGISKSQLSRVYDRHIGVSPKKISDIIKLNQLINQMNSCSSFTKLSYQLDFSDQAHMIHFFKKYTGFTPGQYCSKSYMLPENLSKTIVYRSKRYSFAP